MTTDTTHKTGRTVSPRAVVALILTAIALIFVFQNTDSRKIHFLAWHFSLPTWIWILLVFLLGAIVGSVFPWFRRRRPRR